VRAVKTGDKVHHLQLRCGATLAAGIVLAVLAEQEIVVLFSMNCL
jgi:hypothetical protein